MAAGREGLAAIQGSQLNLFLNGHSHPWRKLFWNLPCMDIKLFSLHNLPFTPLGKIKCQQLLCGKFIHQRLPSTLSIKSKVLPHGCKVLHACPHPWLHLDSSSAFSPRVSFCLNTSSLLPLHCSSVAQSCPTLRPHALPHARLPCPSPTPEPYANSCPLNRWCHLTISFSVISFSFAFNLSQHHGLFQWISTSHQVAKVLGFQHQFFQWIFRIDFLKID